MTSILATLSPQHPRLLATPATWAKLQTRRQSDAGLDAFLTICNAKARALLDVPPVIYEIEGRRLLAVSRTVLRRVLLLALSFHLSNDTLLARRAEAEMLAAAAFVDWNPSHFLDTAEMTAALALGYDWLFDELSEDAKLALKSALVEKGLKPGLIHNNWKDKHNNWNSVCLCGLSLGALALADEEPLLAAQILEMTREFNPNGLAPYAPDGVYPEGPGYWNYGTSFQVVLLAALESALGTDFGLSKSPGFLQSSAAMEHLSGPTGLSFNFSDCGERAGLVSAHWWFARQLKRAVGRSQLNLLARYAASGTLSHPESDGNRLLPLAALWWPASNAVDAPELPRFWHGRGPNPVAVFRDDWNDVGAMFLAVKGGKAALSHGHMDAGSWVFDFEGQRWAFDAGMQEYHGLESKGIGLWDGAQNGARWSVWRLNNFAHNTLSINKELHRIGGEATITHFSDSEPNVGAVLDLSPVFGEQVTRVERGFAFRPNKGVLIRDEIEGLREGDEVRWAMLTRAEIFVDESRSDVAVLRQNGSELRVQLIGAPDAKWERASAQPPEDGFNEPNPGFEFLTVHFKAPASGKLSWSVQLGNETAFVDEEILARTPLKNWPQPSVQSTR